MKNFLQIAKFAKPFKGLFVQIAFAIVIVAVYKQVTPLVSGQIIDVLERYIGGEITSDRAWELMMFSLGILFGFTILNWIAGRISWRQAMILQEKLTGYMRLQVLDHLLTQDVSYFDKQSSGNVMSKVDRGINKVTSQIGESTSFFLPNVLAAILAVIVIIQIRYEFVLLMLVAFVPFILINLWAISKHAPIQKKFNRLYDDEYGHFWEVISSIRLVKSFDKKDFELKKMRSFNKKVFRLTSKILGCGECKRYFSCIVGFWAQCLLNFPSG